MTVHYISNAAPIQAWFCHIKAAERGLSRKKRWLKYSLLPPFALRLALQSL